MEVPKFLPGTTIPAKLVKKTTGEYLEKASLQQMREGVWEVPATPGIGSQIMAAGYVYHEGYRRHQWSWKQSLNLPLVMLCEGRMCDYYHEHHALSVTDGTRTRHYASAGHAWFYETEIAEVKEQCEREIARRPLEEARERAIEARRDCFGRKVGPMYIPERVRKANAAKMRRLVAESVA